MTILAYQNRAAAILFNYLKSIPNNTLFLIPANTCPIVFSTFLKAKIKFKIIDIDESTLLVDTNIVRSTIAKEIRPLGLLFVRTLGFLNEQYSLFQELKEICPSLRIVDDRCLCEPTFKPKFFSKNVDLTLFSTGYSKFAEQGGGGYGYHTYEFTTYKSNYSYEAHDQLLELFNLSIENNIPFHYRDTDWLDSNKPLMPFNEYKEKTILLRNEASDHKAMINSIYQGSFSKNSNITILSDHYNNSRFNLYAKNKNKVIDAIFEEGFFASSHYASMASIFDEGGMAPVAEKVHSKIINLFNDYRISEADAKCIAGIVNKKTQH